MKRRLAPVPLCANRHYNCTYVVLDSMLRFLGCDPAVSLFHTWDFAYSRADGPAFGAWGRRQSLVASLAGLGIGWHSGRHADFPGAWQGAKLLLDEGALVGVTVDVYPLGRAGLFPRQHHAPHAVILSGYDDRQGTAHLVDPSPWQPGEMDVPQALFAQCWNTATLGGGATPAGADYQWEWLCRTGEATPDAAQIAGFLQDNLQAMAGCSRAAEWALGVEGIAVLAEDVGGWGNQPEEALRARLARCFDCLLEIALLREGHAAFLRSAAALCRLPRLGELGGHFERLSEGWTVVRNLFLRGNRQDPRAVLPRARSRLREIAAGERDALEEMDRAARAISG
jgi:hypothetical protein